jgi:glycosyltransferase involved in cell wall biosynthesis
MQISIVICTYNRSAMLARTLASLTSMLMPPGLKWELIIVDNNSKDDTRAVVNDFAARSGLDVRYVFEGAQGLSHARNRGIIEARCDVVVFTDDDVEVEKSWLFEMRRIFEESDCLAAGGKILPVWPAPKPRWYYEEGPYNLNGAILKFDLGDSPCDLKTPPFGANMAFRRLAFDKYGFFRTDLGVCGDIVTRGEETEFFHRLLEARERVVYSPNAIVYHPVSLERMRKTYIQSLFFTAGISQFRVDGLPRDAISYFGVPRYLYRAIAEKFFAWMFSIKPKERLRNKLQMYHTAGMIVESHRMSHIEAVPAAEKIKEENT